MSTATISLLVACSVLLVALSVAASQPASPNSAIVLVNGLPGKANAYFGGSPVVFSFQVDKIVASQRLQLGFWFAPAAFYAQVDSIPTPSNFSWNLTIATQHTFIPTIDIAPNSPGFTVGTLYIAYVSAVSCGAFKLSPLPKWILHRRPQQSEYIVGHRIVREPWSV